MRRYFLKVNGEAHCPGGVCRPASAQDWEGKELLLPLDGPYFPREGRRETAPAIEPGDAFWVWTHEDDKFGRGWGLTATATAGPIRVARDHLAVTLHAVTRLPRPFGFRNFTEDTTGARILDYARAHRHWRAYLIDDDDYPEFSSVVEEMSRPLPDEERLRHTLGWEREVLLHKDALLSGLADRRACLIKPRSGQARFRELLNSRYNDRCVVSHCSVSEALEAAHVLPHTGDPTWDHPDNGLLLRRDLHALFDAMLWSIDPSNDALRVAPSLIGTGYGKLDGRKIQHQVARPLLEVHFRQFRKAASDG